VTVEPTSSQRPGFFVVQYQAALGGRTAGQRAGLQGTRGDGPHVYIMTLGAQTVRVDGQGFLVFNLPYYLPREYFFLLLVTFFVVKILMFFVLKMGYL